MLSRLSIRDIVLIEKLDIDFLPGLSVLTGETGAGKSILLDALSLALGARGDASLVRHGAAQGQVIAVFDVPRNHPARALLAENDIEDDGDIILRRVQTGDGRTRVFVNDQPSSVTLMRDVGRALVEIHGQHDERALVDPGAHRELLDSFGGHLGAVRGTGEAWRYWRNCEQELSRHRAKVEAAAREADYLRASVAELAKLDPQPGEETELAELRAQMMRVEKIAAEIHDAQDVLSGPSSPLPQLASLLRRLQRKAGEAPGLLDDVVKSLDEAMISLDAAQSGVEAALRATEYDPQRLEKAEERLFALRAASRKHNVAVDDLAQLRDTMVADLADLDAGEERLHALEKQAAAAREAYDISAAQLSSLRQAAASGLTKAVMAELPALKLERAEFIVEMGSDAESRMEEGIDQVEFWVRTNPGTRPGPMMKVASGGELSRFLLALKVALADRGSAPTLVFDEIDTGVGGAVADAIGQRLARLSKRVQVLSVTHAPQVAARAATHFLISKSGGKDRVATGIAEMDRAARQEEIARMLAGAVITDEARAAAERLLRENTAAA
ncbi:MULTISPECIES: DNA repair protein RecN [unclassified Mesorhizobium]|uniref:DNA repair protein RecN n=2 Tax=Mesorhizobium TaxID=68287 RepID=UPI000F75B0AD|nr:MULTISPECIES: DNA repair protein RecN [unclassified Mesorhizobium]AZO02332.1 DNA repair protein RecN [Mesorhizobium sp. M2A.F.Ca.ET.043.02.1.1]RUW41614.1 DNA repair protein RecN [Mesorhizobium sp. M2A.F.Ca.ET.015.02.1.1]RVC93412.1 DNA repair protein RecN [Mesorhizobium sp. M2A.F.Ca.ET.017.03.2.1]RVD06615.1 DNA repair protein RecN [Mesorhizobium sp. M2A.F.Ca.ET.029.05.1.1]RWB46468.1 MAG: DNA repair protein RecN [Mesorhizobium sp.]